LNNKPRQAEQARGQQICSVL